MNKSLIILLLVAIATIGTQAATKYQINVAGVEVTSDNKNNVTGGDIKSGTVTYDPTSNTLTLTNVTIIRTGGSNYGVHNRDCAGLRMKFVGTCNVSSNTANALHLDKNTIVEVTSGSTLNASITAGENYGRGVVYVNDNVLATIKGTGTLNISGQMKSGGNSSSCATCGFEGKGMSSNSRLDFTDANVRMNVTHDGIYKFSKVTISSYSDVKVNYRYGFRALDQVGDFSLANQVACVTPADATFNSSSGCFGGNNDYTHFTNDYGAIISTANFPDANFRSYMRGKCHYEGSYQEQYLTKSELQNLTTLNVNSKSISNLTGVALLSYLTELNCSSNSLTSLPSLPTSLQELNCENNQLTSLPTLPSSLQELYCGGNKFSSLTITGKTNLKTLDAKNNTSLTSLNCSNNALNSLNVNGCTAMTSLRCNNNQFISLSPPQSLQELYCGNNKFTSLSVNNFTQLTTLNVANSALLTSLNCSSNALTYLNVDGCTVMTELNCSNNQFTSMPTVPSSLTLLNFSKNKLTSLNTLPNSLINLYVSNNKFTTLTITGKTNLNVLYADNNTSLTSLNCSGNALTHLYVNGCSAMNTLNCSNNELLVLDVSGLSSLTDLQCYRNRLYSLTLQGNTALKTINTFSNDLSSLNVQGCSALNYLNIRANQIKESAMSSLINSMRSIPASEQMGTFYVYGENYSGDKPEGNVITTAQAKTAKDKRWLPQHKVGDNWVDIPTSLRGDLNGDGEVDVTDVNIMIDMVLGKQEKDFTLANLNGDNDVDVSDVSILIDICLGKE